MKFDETISRLREGLRLDLPGPVAQSRLAPMPPRKWPPGFDVAALRHAAGLLLLFPVEGLARIVLTVRADTLDRHRGQVSLPGGAIEPDETVEQAALREAHEEVGLNIDDVHVLGRLTPLDIAVSGFRLHPIVANVDAHPKLVASDGEVARILEVDVDDLLDRRHLVVTTMSRDGVDFRVPAFRVAGTEIWGATAMVLAEFLTLLD
ncbi:MAG TPA: CoA pyrophosphatase [Vicinamibacterales bacterium]|nr:CoA pyrophosphatase [Vicinamibacterales bacterium]